MKKIIGLVILLLAVLAAAAGSTSAYFSDTEESTGNTIISGTLDLGLANTSGTHPAGSTSGTWNISTPSNWKPGDTKSGTLYLYNSGSIPMSNLTVSFIYTGVADGTPSTVHPVGTGLTDQLDEMVKATTATFGGSTVTGIQGKTLKELKAAGNITLPGSLGSLEEKALAITWTYDYAATNGCQGDSVVLTVTVTGNQ